MSAVDTLPFGGSHQPGWREQALAHARRQRARRHPPRVRPGMLFDLVSSRGVYLLTFVLEEITGEKWAGTYRWRERTEDYQSLYRELRVASELGDDKTAQDARRHLREMLGEGLALCRQGWDYPALLVRLERGHLRCQIKGSPRRQ